MTIPEGIGIGLLLIGLMMARPTNPPTRVRIVDPASPTSIRRRVLNPFMIVIAAGGLLFIAWKWGSLIIHAP